MRDRRLGPLLNEPRGVVLGYGWGEEGNTSWASQIPSKSCPPSPANVGLKLETVNPVPKRSSQQLGMSVPRSQGSSTHLVHGPSGHLAGPDVGHARKQLAVLLPAQGEVPGRVGGQRRHEDGLVQGPLRMFHRVR